MTQGKGTSAVGAWLVVGCVAALGFALFGGPKAQTVTVHRSPSPTEATAQPEQPRRSFFDELRDLAPEARMTNARNLAALGLREPATRREAYGLALELLKGFPESHVLNGQAAVLMRELVARQQLPGADRRPVTEMELLAFAVALTTTPDPKAAPAPAPAPGRAPARPVASAGADTPTDAQAIRNGEQAPPSVLGMMRDAGWDEPSPASRSLGLATSPAPVAAAPPTYVPPTNPGGEVQVRGYYRSDGTYVRPHTRSRPSR